MTGEINPISCNILNAKRFFCHSLCYRQSRQKNLGTLEIPHLGWVLIYPIAFFMLYSPANAAEIYKWVDENGQVHYGDRSTEQGSEKIDIKIVPKSKQQTSGNREAKQHRLIQVMAEERQEAAQQRQAQKERLQELKIKCTEARKSLQEMRHATGIYTVNDKGEKLFLSEKEREQAELKLQSRVDSLCK